MGRGICDGFNVVFLVLFVCFGGRWLVFWIFIVIRYFFMYFNNGFIDRLVKKCYVWVKKLIKLLF